MPDSASSIHLTHPPIAKAAMLIRGPVRKVFAAFTDPAITSRFWFTKGSGHLAPGVRVVWEWEMYGASADVTVKEFAPDERIVIAWPG